MAIIGIDLGTTNSLAVCWRDGRLELIPCEDGEVLFPSVVGYVGGEGFLLGAAAKERLLTHPSDTVGSFKCFMGTAKEYRLGGRTYTPMELSAMVLERLKTMDEVAYVRFASVYREFKDINTFMNELKKILDN